MLVDVLGILTLSLVISIVSISSLTKLIRVLKKISTDSTMEISQKLFRSIADFPSESRHILLEKESCTISINIKKNAIITDSECLHCLINFELFNYSI